MASPMWTILDMWENSFCCISTKLVRILCVGVNLFILLPAPTCQGGSLRSSSIWKLGSPKNMVCLRNWQLKGWWMAPWAYNPLLLPSCFGTGWILGYHTPICMLNHVINLQAIAEIITNETARVLSYWLSKILKCVIPSIRTFWP
jgi:hypothetical protein